MTIGVLAKRADIPVSTLRFYEKRGLLSPNSRSRAGYRRYVDGDVPRVRFIRRAQELGFTLREIRELLDFSRQKKLSREQLEAVGHKKVEEIEARLADLMRVKDALASLLSQECIDLDAPCPIIAALGREG